MHSYTLWKFAKRPNYETNVDKIHPYSEVPYLGGYHLNKIPSEDGLIDLVDYWGEGLINSEFGTSGFADSYNVNHEYQLVSNGPDRDRKIPNRIPVLSYSNCSTSAYIKDNSVKLVTLMAAPINKSCASDIARMVNTATGKVIVLGFNENDADVRNLKEALTQKGLTFCHGYELPTNMKGLTLFDTHRAYLNVTDICDELFKSVETNTIDRAVIISTALEEEGNGDVIVDVVKKLLKRAMTTTLDYAYKLQNDKKYYVVDNYLPTALKTAVKGDCCRIINKGTMKQLKADTNGAISAVNAQETNDQLKDYTWKALIRKSENQVTFRIKNDDDKYLQLHEGVISVSSINGDHDETYDWILEPLQVDEDVLVYFKNKKYKQALKIDKETHKISAQNVENIHDVGEFGWFLAPCP